MRILKAQSAFATPDRRRRRLTSALLVLGLSLGTIATTATPVEAATVVVTCFTPAYGNFLVRGLPVKLQALTVNGYVSIDFATLDSGGCAAWVVPPAYRNYWLRTYIEQNDNFFYYQGASAGYAWAWIGPWQQWYPLWSNGHAAPGDDGLFWVVFGVVNCYRGCDFR